MAPITITTLAKAASVLALTHQALAQSCYRPDGRDRNTMPGVQSDEFQPCDSGSGHSMCCNKRYSDSCRANGLCYNSGAKLLWRESCTDPTWKDPACIKLCAGENQLSEQGVPMSTIDSVITICGDNSLCCGAGDFAQRCCDANKGFLIVNGVVVEAHPTPTTTARPTTQTTQVKKPATTTKATDNTNTGGGTNNGGGTDDNNNGDSTNNSGDEDGDSKTGNDKTNDDDDEDKTKAGAGASRSTSPKSGTTTKASSTANKTKPAESYPSAVKDKSEQSNDQDSNNADSSSRATSPTPSGSTKNSASDEKSTDSETSAAGGGSGGNRSALIGGVIGGILGGLILFTIAAWFAVRNRRAQMGGGVRGMFGGIGRSGGLAKLNSATELPGSDGRRFHEVEGDYKQPGVAEVMRTERVGGELPVGKYGDGRDVAYYEMEAAPVTGR